MNTNMNRKNINTNTPNTNINTMANRYIVIMKRVEAFLDVKTQELRIVSSILFIALEDTIEQVVCLY